MKKVTICTYILISSVIVFGVIYRLFNFQYSNEGIFNKDIEREGYSITLKTENIPVEIYIKPEWIAFNQDERKELNINVLKINNTNIILENVLNRGSDIYFSFKTTLDEDSESNEFMYNGQLNDDGSFTTPTGEERVFDKNMDEISIGQSGSGPKTTFSFGIDSENQHLISEGFYVRCKGYNLYEYSKK